MIREHEGSCVEQIQGESGTVVEAGRIRKRSVLGTV